MSVSELLGDTGIRWSPPVIRKAEKLVRENRVHQDHEHDQVWWVDGTERYRVQTDGHTWVSCSCPNGQSASRPTCYHTAAVLMVIRDSENPGYWDQQRLDDAVFAQRVSEGRCGNCGAFMGLSHRCPTLRRSE